MEIDVHRHKIRGHDAQPAAQRERQADIRARYLSAATWESGTIEDSRQLPARPLCLNGAATNELFFKEFWYRYWVLRKVVTSSSQGSRPEKGAGR